ncbi:MAG: glycosyltransferase family 9 protein [Desulfovibrionaceae bacterium]
MPSNKHFVVIRLGAIGDVVLITGILRYLHAHYGYTFTVITKTINTPLLEYHPSITNVVSLSKEQSSGYRMIPYILSQCKDELNFPFIDLHCTLRTKILSLFWKSNVYRYEKKALLRRIYLYTRNTYARNNLLSDSVTQRYYKAFLPFLQNKTIPTEQELTPKAYLTEEEQKHSSKKFPTQKDYIALHPYAAHATKMWDVSYWEKLCSLLDSSQHPYIILGQDKNPILPDKPNNYTNKTTLREAYVLLSKARVLVTADSSLLHMALAVNIPVISLFGPTTKEWGFYPPQPTYIREHPSLSCRPCSLHGNKQCTNTVQQECLRYITPESILNDIVSISS